MGRVKLSEVNISNIKNFIRYNNKKINIDWVTEATGLNIIILIVSIVFLEYNFVFEMGMAVIGMIILLLAVYVVKKMKHTEKNLYLFYGMYATFWSVSSGIAAYGCLKKDFGEDASRIILVVALISVIIAVITYFQCKRRIIRNYFKNNSVVPVVGTGIMTAIIFAGSRTIRNLNRLGISESLVFGFLLCMMMMAFSPQVQYLMKAYCCSLIERQNK